MTPPTTMDKVRRFLPLVFAGALGFALYRERGTLGEAATVLQQAHLRFLVLAAFAQAAYLYLYLMLQRQSLAASGVSLSLSETARIWLQSLLGNVALPGSGNALFIAGATKQGGSAGRASVGLLVGRISDLGSFALVLAVGLFWLARQGQLSPAELLAAGVLIGIIGLWVLPLVLVRFRLPWLIKIVGERNFAEAQTAASLSPRTFARLIGLGLLAHFADLLSFALLLPAFGLALRPEQAIVGFGAAVLFWIVTISPEGIGTSEGGAVLALHAVGVPLPQAAAVAVGFRVLTFWLPLLGGLCLTLSRQRVPRLIALVVAMVGVVNLLSAVQPAFLHRARLLAHILPDLLVNGSRLASAFSGFALLLLAVGLWRGKRMAFLITQAVLLVSIFSHLSKGLDWEEASINLVALGILLASRSRFQALSDSPTLWRGMGILLGAMLFTLAYGTAGFYLLDAHYKVNFNLPAALEQTVAMFTEFRDPGLQPTTGFGRWFADSIYLIAVGSLGYGLTALLAPVLLRRPANESERERAKQIVEQFGASSVARFTLFSDKSYFFSEGGSVIAYALVGRVAVALDDPIGPSEDSEAAMTEFTAFCTCRDWFPAFYHVRPNLLPLYDAHGFKAQCIGHEAVVSLPEFSLAGGARKSLRRSVTKAQEQGFTAEVVLPPHSPALLDEAEAVSDAWLATRGNREKCFSLGWFDRAYLQEGPLAVVRDREGKLVAFANVIPEYGANESTIDLMRRVETETSVMELLFVTLFEWASAQKFATFNLGLAPLSGIGTEADDPPQERAIHFLYRHLDAYYGFQGLYHFKNKFAPVWEPRYLIVPTLATVPAVALAVVRADNGNASLWRLALARGR